MRRLFRLSTRERGMLAEAFLVMAVWRLALWCLPYRVVSRWAVSRRVGAPLESREVAEQVGLAIGRASRRTPWRCTCLVQALAAQWMLSRRRSEVRLRIGVAREDKADLEAHAWVESAGVLVTGGPRSHVARYAVLFPTERTEI
jgi:hypothetical protein